MTETIHVGDFVRVKDWDTIKREFGVHKTSGDSL